MLHSLLRRYLDCRKLEETANVRHRRKFGDDDLNTYDLRLLASVALPFPFASAARTRSSPES